MGGGCCCLKCLSPEGPLLVTSCWAAAAAAANCEATGGGGGGSCGSGFQAGGARSRILSKESIGDLRVTELVKRLRSLNELVLLGCLTQQGLLLHQDWQSCQDPVILSSCQYLVLVVCILHVTF